MPDTPSAADVAALVAEGKDTPQPVFPDHKVKHYRDDAERDLIHRLASALEQVQVARERAEQREEALNVPPEREGR